jgi:hypothetical protein
MTSVYDRHADEDGFLYVQYSSSNGCIWVACIAALYLLGSAASVPITVTVGTFAGAAIVAEHTLWQHRNHHRHHHHNHIVSLSALAESIVSCAVLGVAVSHLDIISCIHSLVAFGIVQGFCSFPFLLRSTFPHSLCIFLAACLCLAACRILCPAAVSAGAFAGVSVAFCRLALKCNSKCGGKSAPC